MLKTPTAELMAAAQSRCFRSDVDTTATWHYPGGEKTIVLVHGFRGDHHGLSAIAGALDDFTVVIPDLPGYGKTPALDAEHNLANYASWLIEFLKQLGTPAVVLGHSFGTLVVAKAHEMGLRTEATVLLNPITETAGATVAGRLAAGFYSLCRLGGLGSYLLRSSAVVRGMSVLMATTWNLRLRSLIHDQHNRYFSNFSEDRVAQEGFSAANNSNVLSFAHALPTKLLLIAGERDIIAPLSGQIKLQKATSARLETLPVGHLTHYEAPVEVAQMVREFWVKS